MGRQKPPGEANLKEEGVGLVEGSRVRLKYGRHELKNVILVICLSFITEILNTKCSTLLPAHSYQSKD